MRRQGTLGPLRNDPWMCNISYDIVGSGSTKLGQITPKIVLIKLRKQCMTGRHAAFGSTIAWCIRGDRCAVVSSLFCIK